jgi:hypothetical protein
MSNHLDVGYTLENPKKSFPAYSISVINKYFTEHFPQIITNINDLSNQNINYIFTTHAWLVRLYLHCDPNYIPSVSNIILQCPSDDAVQKFRQGIVNGHITWHGYPMNTFTEMQNEYIVRSHLRLVHDLDDEFGLPHKTVVSQRDVPGMTAGILPIFVSNGIRAISVGVNVQTSSPAVPRIFRWQHPTNSSIELLALWNANGYGDIFTDNAVTIPDYDEALVFYWRNDNTGPGTADEVIGILSLIQEQYPNATVFSSSFEKYISNLQGQIHKLPIVKGEIGDTWNYGLATDPKKVQQYRHILRFIDNKKKLNQWPENDPIIKQFIFQLLKITEHTWGLDQGTYFNDILNWANEDFIQVTNTSAYRSIIMSWVEQREYISQSLMSKHSVLQELDKELFTLNNMYNSTLNSIKQSSSINSLKQTCGNWNILFGSDGNVKGLYSLTLNRAILNDLYFSHQTLDSQDVENYIYNYSKCAGECPYWVEQDFGKVNLLLTKTVSGIFKTKTIKIVKKQDSCIYTIISKPFNTSSYGPPSYVYTVLDLTNNSTISITLLINNKTKTRLPEAYWLTIIPTNKYNWNVHKVNSMIPISNIITNGTMHMHGTIDGIHGFNPNSVLNIRPIDSALVSFNTQSPYPTPFNKINNVTSIHFMLWTNVWGTDFPLWYPFIETDKNIVYRFSLEIN